MNWIDVFGNITLFDWGDLPPPIEIYSPLWWIQVFKCLRKFRTVVTDEGKAALYTDICNNPTHQSLMTWIILLNHNVSDSQSSNVISLFKYLRIVHIIFFLPIPSWILCRQCFAIKTGKTLIVQFSFRMKTDSMLWINTPHISTFFPTVQRLHSCSPPFLIS